MFQGGIDGIKCLKGLFGIGVLFAELGDECGSGIGRYLREGGGDKGCLMAGVHCLRLVLQRVRMRWLLNRPSLALLGMEAGLALSWVMTRCRLSYVGSMPLALVEIIVV
jgi:hypothetical protein